MRVLVLTNMFPTTERPSFGIFVAEQVDDLRRAGVEVDVLSFDGTRDRREYFRARRGLVARLHSGNFDLVHAHYGLTGAIAASQRTVPVVTTFHGGDYTGLTRWHAAVSWVIARLTTPIVVSAEGVRRLRLRNAHVIPAGVDTERFVPLDRAEARRSLGRDPHAPHALLLGARRLRNKRADLFDAAVALARGSVPELRSVALEGFARDDVHLVMNAADVAVMCSDTEGSPVAVREALACATPVVSVRVGDVDDVLRSLPGCSVVEREPAQLAEGIVSALSAGRPSELRTRAEETSRPVIARRLVTVYQELLADS
jgi:teichuronic acid biosynthesis glycosyltransferase TuaC